MTADTEASRGYFDYDPTNAAVTLQSVTSFYNENGYAVIKAFSLPSDIAPLLEAGKRIIADFHNSEEEASTFSTIDPERTSSEARFLSSATSITCFLEPVTRKPGAAPPVNKIGHALHVHHDLFAAFSRSTAVTEVWNALALRHPAIVQSMYIVKDAHVGGVVTPHRDATFIIPLSRRSADCVAFWWPLQPATLHNGCLMVVPKSHVDGVPLRHFVRTGDALAFSGQPDCLYPDDAYVPLPVCVGDLVLLHGAVVHKSSHNHSDNSRHAYSIHVVEDKLSPDCWIRL